MAVDTQSTSTDVVRSIDVADLPGALDQVLLDVRDYLRTIDVVRDGQVIARITPPPLKITTVHPDDVMRRKVTITPEERERFKRLDAELRARLHELNPEPFDAVEEIRDQRSHGGRL